MNKSKVIRNCFALVVTITTLVYLFVQFLNIPNYQEKEISRVLDTLSIELSQKDFNTNATEKFDSNTYYAIYIKAKSGKLTPLLYDKSFFGDNIKNPKVIYDQHKGNIYFYKRDIASYNYTVWMKRFDIDLYMKYMLIPILVAVLLYIVGALFIRMMLVVSTNNKADIDEDFDIDEEAKYISKELETSLYTREPLTTIPINNDSIDEQSGSPEENRTCEDNTVLELGAYKALWQKEFKTSNHFDENFPFDKLDRLYRFSLTPERYLQKAVSIATSYFRWSSAEVYIAQKEDFVEVTSKQLLDLRYVTIASDASVKGDVFIPLFPYSKSKIFGYLKFTWQYEYDFKIADVLAFLKQLLSKEAKTIFLNYKNNINMKKRLNELVKVSNEMTICFLEVDKRMFFYNTLSEDELTLLNMKILDDVTDNFCGHIVFEVFPFIYGICETVDFPTTKTKLDNFLTETSHNYFISDEIGNIAISFSAGASSKNQRNVNAIELIDEAERYLEMALDQGGDQICGK